jgi:tetratricopeptide (TPR) repeat protein
MTGNHNEAHNAFYEGVACREKRDYTQALTHFLHSLELSEHYKTAQRIAEMYSALGREPEAEEYIERAYHLNPEHSQTATNYAALLIKRGKQELARDVINSILLTTKATIPQSAY